MCRGNSQETVSLIRSYGPTAGALKFFESFPHTCLRTHQALVFGALNRRTRTLPRQLSFPGRLMISECY